MKTLRCALNHNYAILAAQERIREQDGVILQVKSTLLYHAQLQARSAKPATAAPPLLSH